MELEYEFKEPLNKFLKRILYDFLPLFLLYYVILKIIIIDEEIKKIFLIMSVLIFFIKLIKNISQLKKDLKCQKEYEYAVNYGNLKVSSVYDISIDEKNKYCGKITIIGSGDLVDISNIKNNKRFKKLKAEFDVKKRYKIMSYEYNEKYFLDLNSIYNEI